MNKNEISMGHLLHFQVISQINKEQYTHIHSETETEKNMSIIQLIIGMLRMVKMGRYNK